MTEYTSYKKWYQAVDANYDDFEMVGGDDVLVWFEDEGIVAHWENDAGCGWVA